jgi:hypothetical protein
MEVEESATELAAFVILVLVGLDASGCELYLQRCEVNVEVGQSGATPGHGFTFDVTGFTGAVQWLKLIYIR